MPAPRFFSRCSEDALGYLIAKLPERGLRTVVFIMRDDRAMEGVLRQLDFFAPQAETVALPAWDCVPYDRVSPSAGVTGRRAAALARLNERDRPPSFIVTTVNGAAQRVPPASAASAVRTLRVGRPLNRDDLLLFLVESGFRRVVTACDSGDVAVRGGVIDVIPPGQERGLRLDMFGDVLEQIRFFDPVTQISDEKTDQFTFLPASEWTLNEGTRKRFIDQYHRRFGIPHGHDPLYEHIRENRVFPGAEHYLPLFYDKLDSFFALLPANALVVRGLLADESFRRRAELTEDHYRARKEACAHRRKGEDTIATPPLAPEELHLTQQEWDQAAHVFDTLVMTQDDAPPLAPAADWRPCTRYDLEAPLRKETPLALLAEDMAADPSVRTIITCHSEASRKRLLRMAEEEERAMRSAHTFAEALTFPAAMVVAVILPVEHGWLAKGFRFIGEQDLLGERLPAGSSRKRKAENYLREAASLAPGDFVVHEKHGVAKFLGLHVVEAGGQKHDCLKLEYAGGDLFFLPVTGINMLSRYGGSDSGATPDRLGQTAWQKRAAVAKARIKDIAARLLMTAGKRLLAKAPVLMATPADYERFCAGFPYAETEDQLRSAEDVLQDLALGRPMDRLICGDVGFGKTEIALRAAFVASCGEQPMQTVIAAPTTLLARQHLETFRRRFSSTAARVEGLSRLTPAGEAKRIRQGVKDGTVDILVGTHAVLAKGLEYQNLGLVITDEEQQFGVVHKERLKELRADTHMLTLSATPIPRTLQMSLTGIKDLSMIGTPPPDRLEVRTFVTAFDEVSVRNAFLREHARGGACFFVAPRISDLDELLPRLKRLLPEARMAVAHGQMSATSLDDVMTSFYDGAYDLLLSTNIIGSGIDLPTANTIFIWRADRFGLAQLYQMRGRVGRGKMRGYAYMLLPERGLPTEDAMRRLDILHRLDVLGAGFTVASHDMDIRGFGNLLGDEQSGHIKEIGAELYQEMLKEAVEALKSAGGQGGALDGEKAPDKLNPELHLGVDLLIPETYIPQAELRMGLYRRLGFASDELELRALEDETADRFGAMPAATENLFAAARLKLICVRAGVSRLDAGPRGVVLSISVPHIKRDPALFLKAYAVRAKVRPGDKIAVACDWTEKTAPHTKFSEMRDILHMLAGEKEPEGSKKGYWWGGLK